MIPRSNLKKSLVALGYKPRYIVDGYRFAAVEEPAGTIRSTSVAAFFDGPPSYRNAALGIIEAPSDGAMAQAVWQQRSLGAPFLIAIGSDSVSAWTFTSRGAAKLDEGPLSEWDSFLGRHSSQWSAQAIRRTKAIPLRQEAPVQDPLFEPSILYSIQAQVQSALDGLLKAFLAYFQSPPHKSSLSLQRDYSVIFPLAFRLLTAKILHDREDGRISHIDIHNVESVVDAVTHLYSLAPLPIRWTGPLLQQLSSAWATLLGGLYVRNIAADDLAFVYENTLITPDTRKAFGTHSTPPSVAEYVLRSFDLPAGPELQGVRVYEPFAGSCVFLTAALRRFKELLPDNWSPAKMHSHLVSRFNASEVDQFACEIARLSLILADYPNANGWHINNEDLFLGNAIERRITGSNIIICNPPFEDFEAPAKDGDGNLRSVHKPLAAINAFLNTPPNYLGVVMPQGFASHKKYVEVHDRLVDTYADVELLQLPEGTFRHAAVGAVVIIAQDKKTRPGSRTAIRSSAVHRGTANVFESSLRPSVSEVLTIDPRQAPGLTGLRPLRDVWQYLSNYPSLGDVASVHRGLEWNGNKQSTASSTRAQTGWKKGLHRIGESLSQFRILRTSYLDCRQSSSRGSAVDLPWDAAKVLCTAVRTSRSPWRIAACVDESGLVASQQFFGIWLVPQARFRFSLSTIAAILNSPIANAFSFVHDPEQRLRVDITRQIPLPFEDPGRDIAMLIREYQSAIAQDGPLFRTSGESPADLLTEIDARLLAAYDLPPKLEKALLKFMNDGLRPCGHTFGPYLGTELDGAFSLQLRLEERKREDRPMPTWLEILSPLPADVADVFDVR